MKDTRFTATTLKAHIASAIVVGIMAEGWLCIKCVEGLPMKSKKGLCNCGTLVTGVVEFREDGNCTENEVGKHLTEDPMEVPFRKKCRFFNERVEI